MREGGGGLGTSASNFIVWLAMRRELVGWLVLLALASGCSGNEAISGEQATSERKSNLASELYRPLDLPTLPPGAPCPRTPGGRPNPDMAFALGSGPAYPVLGFESGKVPPSPQGLVPLREEDGRGGIYWRKTLWGVDPKYDGPVLIRAWRIDERQRILFGIDNQERQELEFVGQDSDSWRYGPSATLLPGPGCYAFQVDGTNFSKVIVFEAARASKS